MNDKAYIDILLADDDPDDCLFFQEALAELGLPTSFKAVSDGEELTHYLEGLGNELPTVLFLDLNMPRKNGFEWLAELKTHSSFQQIPVIIYSTSSFDEEKSNELFDGEAHYYICKPSDFHELKKLIAHALLLVQENNSTPLKENFLISI